MDKIGIGEVEPHRVDVAIAGQQLGDLPVQELPVPHDVPAAGRLNELPVVAAGMQSVDREVGVMPVDQRVVEADAESPRTERVDQWPNQIFPQRSMAHGVVGQRRVPEREALMVLGGEHHVAHPGAGRLVRPEPGIMQVRVEMLEVRAVLLVGEALGAHDLDALARALPGPVVLHVHTTKGRGYEPAERDEEKRLHDVGPFDPETGVALAVAGRRLSYTEAFGSAIVREAAVRPEGRRTPRCRESTRIESTLSQGRADLTYDVSDQLDEHPGRWRQ